MIPAILLSGTITGKALESVWREVEQYQKLGCREATLVIQSDGGDSDKTFGFIKKIQRTRIRLRAKIYEAQSAAALIALAIPHREMTRSGIFSIHLGGYWIESCDFIHNGTIPAHLVSRARQCRKKTFELMKKCGIPEQGSHIDKLQAQNRLTLTADECLRLGIIERII